MLLPKSLVYAATACLLHLALCACQPGIARLIIETDRGHIEAEVYLKKAPVTAGNFLDLVDKGAYNHQGATFYRVTRLDNQPDKAVKIDVVQGGLRTTDTQKHVPIRHETTHETGLKHLDGSLSMARAEPGTASSEFFICLGHQPALDYGGKRNPDGQGFAVFGKIVSGMHLVRQMQQLPDTQQYLVAPVPILTIRRK